MLPAVLSLEVIASAGLADIVAFAADEALGANRFGTNRGFGKQGQP